MLVVYGFDSYNQAIFAETSQTLKEHGGGDTYPKVLVMTYQTATGTLSPGAHPGSYNGQDAYNDMLVTDGSSKHGQWATAQHGDGRTGEPLGLYARCPSRHDQRERERVWQKVLCAA